MRNYLFLFVISIILFSCTKDGYKELIVGCTDPASFTYNPLANTNDNSCCYVAGCTDSAAVNYVPDACFDDGSCDGTVYGCTDPLAPNYNEAAVVDDGTCLISFNNHIVPVFESRCVQCHGFGSPYVQLTPAGTAYSGLINGFSIEGFSYINTDQPNQSYLYQLVSGGLKTIIMPPNGPTLSSDEVENILLWIEQGAQNN